MQNGEGSGDFQTHVDQLLKAIDLCLQGKLYIPGLLLIYAGFDGMAWLERPQGQYDVKQADFVKWVENYLLPNSELKCSSVDLYAARCGLLHTGTATSSRTRSGHARKMFYTIGEKGEALFQLTLNDKKLPVFVEVHKLADALVSGIARFQEQIKADASLAELVYTRARDYFSEVQMNPQRPIGGEAMLES